MNHQIPDVRLRLPVPADAERIFRWRNTPFVRDRASTPREVTPEEHRRWFEEILRGDVRLMFIVEIGGEPAGQVRFDRSTDGGCVLSVYLLEPFTGRGYGISAIREGCRALFGVWDVPMVVAWARADNRAARSAFRKAGFAEDTSRPGGPSDHVAFVLFRTNPPGTGADSERAEERKVREYFTDLAARYGEDARSLDWPGRAAQDLRFSVLAEAGALAGARILDVGCGQGDFLGWLRARGADVDYTGLDLTPVLLATARRRFPDARFVEGSLASPEKALAERYDYVFASGIFYRRETAPVAFLQSTVVRMFALCSRALAFNSLSAWTEPSAAVGEFRADPEAVVSFARTLAPWVVLRHDYHPGDFTIYLYREPRRP